jgi:hypothetical protein
LTKFEQNQSIVLMFFPDVLKLLNRLGVRPVNDVTAQVTADVMAGMDPEGMSAPALVPTSDVEMPSSAAPALVSTSDTEVHAGHNAQPLPVVATASAYALLHGKDLAPVVQEAPSSSLVLPPGCFVVPSKNASMYGKKMRDVHIAGFSMESDALIRFRTSDGKVVVGDLLVGVGKFNRLDNAVRSITSFIENNDDIVKDLGSIQIDKTLTEKVCT